MEMSDFLSRCLLPVSSITILSPCSVENGATLQFEKQFSKKNLIKAARTSQPQRRNALTMCKLQGIRPNTSQKTFSTSYIQSDGFFSPYKTQLQATAKSQGTTKNTHGQSIYSLVYFRITESPRSKSPGIFTAWRTIHQVIKPDESISFNIEHHPGTQIRIAVGWISKP